MSNTDSKTSKSTTCQTYMTTYIIKHYHVIGLLNRKYTRISRDTHLVDLAAGFEACNNPFQKWKSKKDTLLKVCSSTNSILCWAFPPPRTPCNTIYHQLKNLFIWVRYVISSWPKTPEKGNEDWVVAYWVYYMICYEQIWVSANSSTVHKDWPSHTRHWNFNIFSMAKMFNKPSKWPTYIFSPLIAKRMSLILPYLKLTI